MSFKDEANLGMGSLTFWGNMPAMNIFNVMRDCGHGLEEQGQDIEQEINILLIGQGDCRHVLKTLASMSIKERDNSPKSNIQIYILESSLHLYARQILLLYLGLLPNDKVGPYEKVLMFMDILGNLLIRPQSGKMIRKCAKELIQVITDDQCRNRVLSIIHLDDLKHRERDEICEILNFWSHCAITKEDIEALWDARLRQTLQQRYDARFPVFDWDYHMGMTNKNPDTKIVNIEEYKKWRNTGLAFAGYEHDYNQPNVTLIKGKNRPFNGDMLIGPFIPYGIICEDESFYEKMNNEYKNKSKDVTFHNLEKILRLLGSDSASSDNIHIHFLPLDGSSTNLSKKSKFLNKFDFIWISNFMGQEIRMELTMLMKQNGLLVIDKTRYVWYFKEENDKAFDKKITELAENAGLELKMTTKDYLTFNLKNDTK